MRVRDSQHLLVKSAVTVVTEFVKGHQDNAGVEILDGVVPIVLVDKDVVEDSRIPGVASSEDNMR